MEQPQQDQNNQQYISMPQAQVIQDSMHSIQKMLSEISNVLVILKREFRGEGLITDEEGNNHWIQVTKPVFVKMDLKKNLPIKETVKMPTGEIKEIYIPNDEAIEEILSQLKFMGVNQITTLAGIDEDNYLDDLKEFECKLAAVLALKQKEWGLDKELLAMTQTKIKTIVQDARSLALDGRTLKAIQTTVSRVEQMIEGQANKSRVNPYG